MPVEIKELIIRVVVNNDDEVQSPPPSGSAVADKETIVQECVSQVLRILKKSEER